ncbi:MAG: fumarylacetoacetate hydrolase family protein [Pseudomonadota bacterium]
MRLASFEADGAQRFGAVTEDGLIDLSSDFSNFPTLLDAIQQGTLEALTKAAQSREVTHTRVRYLPPLPNAPRILCVGVNFPDRNAEYKDGSAQPKHMSLFPRFISGFVGHGDNLIRPPESHQLDYEGELAIVIGKPGRRIPSAQAYNHICALTLCNEGTIRDWVRHAKFNVTQGKNWDRSGAMGPWLVPFTSADQIDGAQITTHVNGELRQEDALANMMFPVREQIAYISTFMALQAGDIIVTGTPTGAGARLDPPQFLKPGDQVEVCIDGIGTLSNGVADE